MALEWTAAPEAARARVRKYRARGERVAFVPTMGALHEGHLSLVARARRGADRVVASIFVNPLQFTDPKDLKKYPRNLARDRALLARAGVDLVFAPRAFYRKGHATRVVVGGLDTVLEGAHRPGHFTGVATVVAKLFAAVGACSAYFGEKDAQQFAVVRRMVRDLSLPVEVRCGPVVREPDGLALSSRNRLLSPEQREAATCLLLALSEAAELARAGERDAGRLVAAMAREIGATPQARIDYVAVVDEETFEELSAIAGPARALVAARFGGVRLIDTLLLPSA